MNNRQLINLIREEAGVAGIGTKTALIYEFLNDEAKILAGKMNLDEFYSPGLVFIPASNGIGYVPVPGTVMRIEEESVYLLPSNDVLRRVRLLPRKQFTRDNLGQAYAYRWTPATSRMYIYPSADILTTDRVVANVYATPSDITNSPLTNYPYPRLIPYLKLKTAARLAIHMESKKASALEARAGEAYLALQ